MKTQSQKFLNFRIRGYGWQHTTIHPEEKRWLMPQEMVSRYLLPKSCYFKSIQILTFCRSRLKDLSVEGVKTCFDEVASLLPGSYGISNLYGVLRGKLSKF